MDTLLKKCKSSWTHKQYWFWMAFSLWNLLKKGQFEIINTESFVEQHEICTPSAKWKTRLWHRSPHKAISTAWCCQLWMTQTYLQLWTTEYWHDISVFHSIVFAFFFLAHLKTHVKSALQCWKHHLYPCFLHIH